MEVFCGRYAPLCGVCPCFLQVLSGKELALVSRAVAAGRPLLVAANKMDAMPGDSEKQQYLSTLRERLVSGWLTGWLAS
jgi:hypothetical protein